MNSRPVEGMSVQEFELSGLLCRSTHHRRVRPRSIQDTLELCPRLDGAGERLKIIVKPSSEVLSVFNDKGMETVRV